MKKIILLNNIAHSVLGFRRHLIKFLVKHGYQVYAMATDFTKETKKEVEKLGAIPLDYALSRGGMNPFADFKSIKALSAIFKEISPDVVISSFTKPAIYGTLAASQAKVPKIIAMIEGLGFFFTEQPGKEPLKTKIIRNVQVFLYKLALPKADLVLFLNKDDPKDLLERYQIKTQKYDVLGGIGVDLTHFPATPVPIQPISFIFVGRLLKEKGIHEYLNAAKIVKEKYPEVQFKVLGGLDKENPGSLSEQELNFYIENEYIIYPGFVDNVMEWVSGSSAFVLPSYREGMPFSTQEAMAAGRAIITTDVPGCRETVIQGKNGFLIPKWKPDLLAEKMLYLIENPDSLISMGKHSREMAEKYFDANKINQKILSIISHTNEAL
ncbi:glycosyl transferase family 1 [Pasteurellaceae bacterium RH1A]|nr:glycosyl transferase family 1 [Pasteurellaceae bacterium RH1A]